ncbi:hypothetical protein HK097_001358, partial [Rhizophlyctis rosea]
KVLEVEDLLEALGVKEFHNRPYHPETQGCVERMNGTLKTRLNRMFVHQLIKDPTFGEAERFVNDVVETLRHKKHTVHRFTPFELHQGRTDPAFFTAINMIVPPAVVHPEEELLKMYLLVEERQQKRALYEVERRMQSVVMGKAIKKGRTVLVRTEKRRKSKSAPVWEVMAQVVGGPLNEVDDVFFDIGAVECKLADWKGKEEKLNKVIRESWVSKSREEHINALMKNL